LREEEQLKHEYETYCRTSSVELTEEQRALVRQLSQDIPAIWNAATTTPQDRQQIVRMLLDRIELNIEGKSEQTEITLTWAGGFISRQHYRRTVISYKQLSNLDELIQRIVELENSGLDLKQIAKQINQEGYTSLRGRPFSGMMLSRLLVKHGIHPRRKMPVSESLLQANEWWLPDLAKQLGIPPATLSHWKKRGWINGRKLPHGLGRWIIWADAAEVERLKQLRTTRRRWSDCPYPKELTTPKPNPSDAS
jgi:hypothetical protein